jgi:hypothetical protein
MGNGFRLTLKRVKNAALLERRWPHTRPDLPYREVAYAVLSENVAISKNPKSRVCGRGDRGLNVVAPA